SYKKSCNTAWYMIFICSCFLHRHKKETTLVDVVSFLGSILFDVGELHQHLFCIKKYRKDTLKSFRINLATNS
ncbi:TPA: hypothetical protein ACKE91_002777, partial [Enterococcus faecium]